MDLNAAHHPSGVHTFSSIAVDLVHQRLPLYEDVVRWGGDYRTSVDQMHWEIDEGTEVARDVAQRLVHTSRGTRLLQANPGQGKYI